MYNVILLEKRATESTIRKQMKTGQNGLKGNVAKMNPFKNIFLSRQKIDPPARPVLQRTAFSVNDTAEVRRVIYRRLCGRQRFNALRGAKDGLTFISDLPRQSEGVKRCNSVRRPRRVFKHLCVCVCIISL